MVASLLYLSMFKLFGGWNEHNTFSGEVIEKSQLLLAFVA
jgi:hypothetical protein